MKIICIGDNVADYYVHTSVYYPGGNCVNVAVSIKRNGVDGIEYLGVFGDDEQADHIKECLDKEKISYVRSRKVYGKSGFPQVGITDSGDRKFLGGPKDTTQHTLSIRLTDNELEQLKAYDLCHTSCYSSFNSQVLRACNYTSISYDFSDTHDEKVLNELCPYIKLAFFSGDGMSKDEIYALMEKVVTLGTEVCIVTLGDKGSIARDESGVYEYGIEKVERMVDAMGAGDSFIGAFIVEYLKTKKVNEALKKGAVSAAITCGEEGAFGYPKNYTM